MNDSIVTGLFTISGTFIGGLISYFIGRNSKEFEQLKVHVRFLAKQTISHWHLEKLYSEEVSKITSKSTKTVLQDFREKIENMGFDRPTMTEKEAKKILNKYS